MTALIVSATPEEATHVPAGMRVLITGVGKVPAAAAVAQALALDPSIEEVVNIGSAGALHDRLEGLHEVARVLNHDLSADVLRSLGYDPQEWLDLPVTDGRHFRLDTATVSVLGWERESPVVLRWNA